MKRGDKIIYRQKQCAGCRFFAEKDSFCIKRNKRFCDMDIWEDCKYFEAKGKGGEIKK